MLQIKNSEANLNHIPTTLLVLHLMNFSDSTCHVGYFRNTSRHKYTAFKLLTTQGQTTFTFYQTKWQQGQYTAVFLCLFHTMIHQN